MAIYLKSISKKTLILLMVMILVLNLFFVPRSSAFLQFALGGLAVGEAIFYTAAILAGGYTLYEAYDSFTSDSMTSKYFKQVIGTQWANMSATAKSGWATLEESTRTGVASLVLTLEQWKQAVAAGLTSFGVDRAITPAFPLPDARYNTGGTSYFSVTHDYFVKYAVLEFRMNNSHFALMPWQIYQGSHIEYRWALELASGEYLFGYYPPADATTFTAPYLRVGGGSIEHRLNVSWRSLTPPSVAGLEYQMPGDWGAKMNQVLDALPVMQGLLESVYGGTAVSMPQTWVPTIPSTKDMTKPIPIPVPTGAVATPGSLALNPADVKTAIGTMTGDVATDVPGTIVDTIKNFFDLSKPIDWSPMRAVPQVATKAFPFSLPWDVGRAIDTLTVTGKRPEFELSVMVNGKAVKQSVPFAEWIDPLVPYIRSSIVFIFTFGLIFATRKLFGGAK